MAGVEFYFLFCRRARWVSSCTKSFAKNTFSFCKFILGINLFMYSFLLARQCRAGCINFLSGWSLVVNAERGILSFVLQISYLHLLLTPIFSYYSPQHCWVSSTALHCWDPRPKCVSAAAQKALPNFLFYTLTLDKSSVVLTIKIFYPLKSTDLSQNISILQ